MCSDKERLEILLAHLKMNANELASSLGYKRADRIYHVLKERNGISSSMARDICLLFPEINFNWISKGEGELLNQKKENIEIDEPDKEIIPTLLKNKNEEKNQAEPLNPNAIINVPLVNQYAYAGYLNGYHNETYMNTLPTIPFIADHEARGNYIAFEVKGDSMNDGTEESYLEGDRLLCREIPSYLWVDSKLHIKKWDFVIVHEEGILVKRITNHDVENHNITVHSLNDFYPDRIIDLAEVRQIFNVVEMQRPRRR